MASHILKLTKFVSRLVIYFFHFVSPLATNIKLVAPNIVFQPPGLIPSSK